LSASLFSSSVTAQVIKHIQTFKFEPEHIEFIKTILPAAEPAFFGEQW